MFRTFAFSALAGLALTSTAIAGGHSKDIVDIAAGNDDFATLVAAVTAADLVDTLKGDGPFTVFAPTDAAFAALPEGTVDNLLKPENKDQLAAILSYHVVPGKVSSTDLVDGMKAATVEGSAITVSLTGGVMIDDANVIQADIEAENGVIHVIDKVILPAD
ncbi:MAG: Nex18 symbiotically induced protein [Alphaproteobacteria bacterium MedPE-SWcel]|nr:MAG: Nex18 symbiotically induced protein [Alphaproteobacteria bacterium MedPE-SWcel]